MPRIIAASLFSVLYLLICACRPAHAEPAALVLPPELHALPRYLFVGETHGTAEMPAFFTLLAREYLRDNPRLVVGLPLNPVEQEAINRFLADGKASDDVAEKRLLKERGWRGYAGKVDGRYSQAMLQVLRDLRATAQRQRNGYPKVVALATGSDEHAAHILQQAMARSVGARALVLSASEHAMKQPATGASGPKPMPMFFPAGKTFSLDVLAREGTAWACGKDCGPMPLPGSAAPPPCPEDCFVRPQPGDPFDARYVLVRATASPPAARAATK